MDYNIAVIPGDGIGPEVVAEGTKVLEAVGKRFGHTFSFKTGMMGGIAIDKTGAALPPETLEIAQKADSILFGAVGGPKWDDPRAKTRPEDGLLAIRKALKLYANLRPVKAHPRLVGASPLKRELVTGVDFVVIRELTGGLYFAKPKKRWENKDGRMAVDTLKYSEAEVRRVLKVGYELARSRRKKLASVDKANVLASSRLWREIAMEMAKQYDDVETRHILVDACAMQIIQRPRDFDVIVTENMFGDILTDEAAVIAGSMGLLPSASLGVKKVRKPGAGQFGLYEPIHGSAPDIAGQRKANPLATILSAAMMLRLSFGLPEEAEAIENAVDGALSDGYRTADIATESDRLVETRTMGDLVVEKVRKA